MTVDEAILTRTCAKCLHQRDPETGFWSRRRECKVCVSARVREDARRRRRREGKKVCVNNKLKTHCWRGHEFTPENSRPRGPEGRQRECMACVRIRNKQRYQKQRELQGKLYKQRGKW